MIMGGDLMNIIMLRKFSKDLLSRIKSCEDKGHVAPNKNSGLCDWCYLPYKKENPTKEDLVTAAGLYAIKCLLDYTGIKSHRDTFGLFR